MFHTRRPEPSARHTTLHQTAGEDIRYWFSTACEVASNPNALADYLEENTKTSQLQVSLCKPTGKLRIQCGDISS
jgi:hypothetical protein